MGCFRIFDTRKTARAGEVVALNNAEAGWEVSHLHLESYLRDVTGEFQIAWPMSLLSPMRSYQRTAR